MGVLLWVWWYEGGGMGGCMEVVVLGRWYGGVGMGVVVWVVLWVWWYGHCGVDGMDVVWGW